MVVFLLISLSNGYLKCFCTVLSFSNFSLNAFYVKAVTSLWVVSSVVKWISRPTSTHSHCAARSAMTEYYRSSSVTFICSSFAFIFIW